MNILILEPYFTGSHKTWAEGYKHHSSFEINILSMPGQFWKWRMHGGAITLAGDFLNSNLKPDLLLATDMLDLTTFLALSGKSKMPKIPAAVYFHENQLSYPWSPADRDVIEKRDHHYGFINIVSALASDHNFFNSNYHLESFLTSAGRLLKQFPDLKELESVEKIRNKSSILPLGLDLIKFDRFKDIHIKTEPPLILWNHRWEFDKNPEEFFKALIILHEKGINFRLAIVGENFKKVPEIFNRAKEILGGKIIQFGYCDSFEDYARWLWKADILPVTSIQDFFGISILEAIYCSTLPLLPKRLSYFELWGGNTHNNFFYNNFDELVSRLEKALKSPSGSSPDLRAEAKKYDWSYMAPVYDRRFSAIVKE
ncbi:MAG: DUF3524 domain-containing protein [Candidatus Neomarinimicrobiota bacterium]